MDSVTITGAAGFIGRALSRRLREAGSAVVGVDVEADPTQGIVAGDISKPGVWQGAAGGAEVVIHTAAAVTNTATDELGWRVNVLGTKHALDAAVAAGARRFVHFSSVRAFGDSGFPDGVTEEDPVRPGRSVYVNTKIASEQVALQAHAAGRIEVTIIRPGDVYGPRSRPWTVLIVEAIAANQFLLPAMGKGIFSPVYVDNLVDGVLLAASRPEGVGEVFTISDGVGVPCAEFFGHYYRMLGRKGPRTLPTAVAVGAAAIPEALAALTGRKTEIRRESMRYLARDGTYSIDKARALLGYEPAVDLNEGMGRTEAWLREQGLLD
jgi:nucleoside-diphosphate-sugar epimerase